MKRLSENCGGCIHQSFGLPKPNRLIIFSPTFAPPFLSPSHISLPPASLLVPLLLSFSRRFLLLSSLPASLPLIVAPTLPPSVVLIASSLPLSCLSPSPLSELHGASTKDTSRPEASHAVCSVCAASKEAEMRESLGAGTLTPKYRPRAFRKLIRKIAILQMPTSRHWWYRGVKQRPPCEHMRSSWPVSAVDRSLSERISV